MPKYMKLQWEASLRSKEGSFLEKHGRKLPLEARGGLLTPLQ